MKITITNVFNGLLKEIMVEKHDFRELLKIVNFYGVHKIYELKVVW